MNSDNPLFVDELCREIAHATPSPEVLNELCREMTIQRQSIVNIEPQLRRVTQQQPGTRDAIADRCISACDRAGIRRPKRDDGDAAYHAD